MYVSLLLLNLEKGERIMAHKKKREAVSNVRKSESAMMKAKTSRMKKIEEWKKKILADIKEKNLSVDELRKIGFNREEFKKDLDLPRTKGAMQAIDEYYGPGTAKKLTQTRREQAYDSMRGNQSGGMIGQSDMTAKKVTAPKAKKKIPQYYKGGGKVKKNYAYGGRVAKYKE